MLNLKTIIISSCIITILLFAGCDSLLPDDFEETTYKASETDALACSGLSQQAADSLGNLINPNYDAAQLQELRDVLPPADTTALQGWTDNQIILAKFNQLISGLPALKKDSLYLLSYPAGTAVSYAGLTVSAGSDLALYTSFEFTSQNINQYVVVQIVKSDTSNISISDNMTGETISACSQTVVVDSRDRVIPTLKSRLQFHVDPGSYIVRFIVSQPSTVGPFKITIL